MARSRPSRAFVPAFVNLQPLPPPSGSPSLRLDTLVPSSAMFTLRGDMRGLPSGPLCSFHPSDVNLLSSLPSLPSTSHTPHLGSRAATRPEFGGPRKYNSDAWQPHASRHFRLFFQIEREILPRRRDEGAVLSQQGFTTNCRPEDASGSIRCSRSPAFPFSTTPRSFPPHSFFAHIIFLPLGTQVDGWSFLSILFPSLVSRSARASLDMSSQRTGLTAFNRQCGYER